jgi:hypothetical protein
MAGSIRRARWAGRIRRRRDQLRAHDDDPGHPVDDPAVAQNDALTTTEDTAITTGNVLADNGSGPDGDPDSAFQVTAVSGGTLGTQFALPSGAAPDGQCRRHVQL